jgi:outer membrane protein OmpA-like peptidoglycan-associated protein
MSSLKHTGSVILLPPEQVGVQGHRPDAHLACVSLGVRVLVVTATLLVFGGCSTLQRWTTHTAPVAPPAAAPDHPQARTAPAAVAPSGAVVPHQAAAVATTVASVPVATASETRTYANASVRRTLASGDRNALGPTDVGYYMDILQGRLTQSIGKDGRIERRGDSILLLLPMGFDIDSPQLNPVGRQKLRALTGILVEYRLTVVSVQIRGVDSDAHAANSLLANDRAGVLSKYLADAGIAGKRIATAGEGSRLPEMAGAGDQPDGIRVELQLSPIVATANPL